ncbi:MAG: peptide-methionine (R)-S-oxide reductase [Flavobacteriaceae bacterium CG_4_8_14_3_um_filter_34_10]|nr:peptide-methionine (R)-S-oxide reductase MsrB [Flavobacteriia bacterium]OIP49117.1 MAG: peptide-methionine (R)-S-oxide reductase [Flavobacteriaceae bacterium CG2_30_34_30]PIQ19596.1 MAG: peptide-methionine (R)-S-oxide reductase [Flavobacteriaceae bacterium CG18_big_fil_WC_8_21_14_2_50_34_36]PIV49998.1 MAG: peptide-methionine (R)-S-oxide reductase [Flavobacteriaceae bacterium CG02_land_8_20_14_3_00_34_13]PIX10178.1 MAG: peptide-methionine (R)-S-oxide reductase [Flavobacteriaceae bacterium CG_
MNKIAILILSILTFSCNSKAQEIKKEVQKYAVVKTETQWKAQLSDIEYSVLRQAGTERAFSSPLNKNKVEGIYVCKACGVPLYKSEYKFDSGTGWPSFDRAIEKNIEYDVDYKIGYARSELKCSNCGSHLGHVFDDGPKNTTGMRHCINGVALKFIPKKQ